MIMTVAKGTNMEEQKKKFKIKYIFLILFLVVIGIGAFFGIKQLLISKDAYIADGHFNIAQDIYAFDVPASVSKKEWIIVGDTLYYNLSPRADNPYTIVTKVEYENDTVIVTLKHKKHITSNAMMVESKNLKPHIKQHLVVKLKQQVNNVKLKYAN